MEASEKDLLRAAAKAARDRAIEKAKREYAEAIAGIDAVAKLRKQLENKEKRGRGRKHGDLDDSKLSAGILRILPQLGDTFTLTDLESTLNDSESNRGSISTAAIRLAKEKRGIEILVPGRGRREPVYRKVGA